MKASETISARHESALHRLLRRQPFRRPNKRQAFAAIMLRNLDMVEDLETYIRQLDDEGRSDEADQVIELTKRLLDNNKELQTVVSQVLSDSD